MSREKLMSQIKLCEEIQAKLNPTYDADTIVAISRYILETARRIDELDKDKST